MKTKRVAWGTAALLGVVVLVGVGFLAVWVRAYRVARYRGEEASLRGAVLLYAPLRGANLKEADLRDTILSGADLRGADLRGAQLRGAKLSGADLSRAVMTGVDLSAADLRHANLRGTPLIDADLRGANLTQANLRNAWLIGSDLRGVVLRKADLSEARLGSVLQGADIQDAVLTNLVYYPDTVWPEGFDPKKHGARALEPKADLRSLNLDGMTLSRQRLQQANLEGASLRQAMLLGTNLQKAHLKGVDLTGAELAGADVSGADLRQAKLRNAKLRDAIYDRHTRWPRGFDPRRHGAKLMVLSPKPAPWQRLLRQRHPLPDGRILSLEAVTYGDEHRWPPNSGVEEPQGLAQLYGMDRSVYHTSSRVLLLWMVLWDENQRASSYSLDARLVASDGQGRSYTADVIDQNAPGPPHPFDPRRKGATTVWKLARFPRRGESFRARVLAKGRTVPLAEFVVPNPTPGASRAWRPERLPITKKVGNVAFTLTQLVSGVLPQELPRDLPERSAGAVGAFRISQNGKPSRAWVPRLAQVSDVTGNTASFGRWEPFEGGESHVYFENDPLPEDVWKLQVEFVQVAEFVPEEVWTVRRVPVAGLGKWTPVNATTTLRGATLRLRSLAGEGTIHANSDPAVLVKGTGVPADRRLVLVRAVDDRGRDVHAYKPQPDVRLNQPTSAHGEWQFRLSSLGDARTVDLTFALQRRETVEFIARRTWSTRAHARQHAARGTMSPPTSGR